MLPKTVTPAEFRHHKFGLRNVANCAKSSGHGLHTRELVRLAEVYRVACSDKGKFPFVFISKFPCFLYPIPGAVDDAYAVLFTILKILLGDKLLAECTEYDSFELLLLVLDIGQQLKTLHLLTRTLLTVALLEVHHEQRHCLLRLLDFLPSALQLLLLSRALLLLLLAYGELAY